MRKRIVIIISILFVIFLLSYWRVKEKYYQVKFDMTSSQKEVSSNKEIERIFSGFEQVSFKNLEKEYKYYTKSNEEKYKKLLLGKKYYLLTRDDFFRFIVGDIRINQLLPKDKYYKRSLSDNSKKYYWLINKKLLKKLLQLQELLEKSGYNKKGFTITDGYRHPRENERVGGAKLSRHIKGEAIDISIDDIDKSGGFEQADKKIVLDLLEKYIIKSEGGIGKYPDTRAVHFDVRGYKARWDSY